jgi:cytochrome b subunit of formate dehydrogenase
MVPERYSIVEEGAEMSERKYLRFPRSYRVEHWLLVASFTTLAITGLVQKYATVGLSQGIMSLMGGVENVRLIHHIAAAVMMLEAVYHMGAIAYRVFVRRVRLTMLPGLDDLRAILGHFLHNLGLRHTKPQEARYTAAEKFEYWALIWGTLIMGITGFMMWNPIATTQILPGDFVPAAKAAHSGEALLAVLAVLVWHFYHVHVKQFNKSIFTGYLSEDEMIEEHPLELADIKSGTAQRLVDAKGVRQRRRIFFPIYGAISLLLLAGIVYFTTFEQTAITTLPPAEDVQVFAPLTPTPLPSPLPTEPRLDDAPRSWEDGIADLMMGKCGSCHSGDAALAGLDLSTYGGTLAGGSAGPAIVPGEPNNSLLVRRQAEGTHPGQFSGEELSWIVDWIEAGAPER